jgi:hypothetical protein
MKPTRILEVLDLALEVRKNGGKFIPLFAGAAGVGKSEICQQWAAGQRKKNPKFGFIDLRLAYKEGPDLLGRTKDHQDANGRVRTVHNLPSFWPTEGEGLLLLEEPNRAPTMVTNCIMQLLTDRKVEDYSLPEGWIIAGAINPDSAEYDVNTMDTALRNRFIEFEIEYDHNAFVEFIEANKWDESILHFIKSGAWTYREASSLGRDGKYISPRTWQQLNAAHKAGAKEEKTFHRQICTATLGKDVGNELWKFVHDESPVMAKDLIESKDKALKRLKEMAKTGNYQGDKISVTVDSIIQHYGGPKTEKSKNKDLVDEETMIAVARIINSDQAVVMLKQCGQKISGGNVINYFKEITTKYPDMVDILKANIKLTGGK